MRKKNTSSKQKFLLLMGVLVLVAAGFISMYLYNNNSLGSQNASAGSVKTLKLADYKLDLSQTSPLQFSAMFIKSPVYTWRYTVSGKVQGCYTPSVEVTNSPTNLKPADVPNQPTIVLLKLVQNKNCTDASTKDYSSNGTLTGYNGTPIRFVVQYQSLNAQSKVGSTTKKVTLITNGYTLVSTLNPKTSLWQYTITGETYDCYKATTDTAYEVPAGQKTSVFNGVYYLRLNARNATCTGKKQLVKVSGTVPNVGFDGKVHRFFVRYVTTDTLRESRTQSAYDSATSKKLTSGLVTLEYKYDTAGKKWDYTASGCNIMSVGSKAVSTKAVTVTVMCNKLTKAYTTEVGSVTADSDAVFDLKVTNGTMQTFAR